MPPEQEKLLAAVAETALAALLAGPIGGLRQAGTSVISFLTETPKRSNAEAILRAIRRDLERFSRSEPSAKPNIEPALSTAELAFANGGATTAECLDLGLDPQRVANRVIGRATPLLRTLDEGTADLTAQIVHRVCLKLLASPDAIPDLDREFQRFVVGRLAEIDRLPFDTATAVRDIAAVGLLTDPRRIWRGDEYPPSALVRAEFGVVRFRGREFELRELTNWCSTGPAVALRLYAGAGGMGKTRLMLEACSMMRGDGWRAGFSARGPLNALPLLFQLDAPLFVVVDYAELQRPILRELVECALQRSARFPTRVVALARSRGDWWADLANSGQGVGEFFVGPATQIVQLGSLAATMQQRQEIALAAMERFAYALQRPMPSIPALDVEAPHHERVLFLHLAALAAVLGDVPSDERRLLDFALRRERRYWDEAITTAGFPTLAGRPVEQAAAVATLAGNLSNRDAAIRAVARAPLLSGQPTAALNAVTEVLHQLYPGDGWLAGVQPDLLGEHLVFRAGQADHSIFGWIRDPD